jgi:hypothetical protein
MTSYFTTRAAQDVAVERLLVYIGQSTTIFCQDFIEELDGSDHEITAAIILKFVDIWIDGKGGVHIRVSEEGRGWLSEYQNRPKKAKKPIHMPLHNTAQ